ncbi:NAD-dependent epimerase/dehydratase family protein [Candidatus Uabimicrobium amorphum]|uniref:NAD-dependent dehydratase n=1 Tax=Uabimicrobium amorphum TaxID=2596890 RepID=A0A5S9ILP7_UABAM|nr:NAD-dependent epimerase/dehydratase family protein [Candidatus Uabimicrobium amorphum]BBM84179.1 NAD-dependent dehydratase [Candidatus Uabimicrobium amorphum]
MTKILVTGAGGFIGHHLVTFLKQKGYWVRGVDIKKPEFADTDADEFQLLDLKKIENCLRATQDMEQVFHLAANMGGIGFIETHKADIVFENTVIDMHMLHAAKTNKVQKFLYTSSACIYPAYKQDTPDIVPLKEEDAYPALPEDGYGWEKLYIERACRHYREDYGLKTYMVRFHNIFGPLGTYDGGREKSPAAICRKVALAKTQDEIEVWGDGQQTRSYCYIEDCVVGMYKLMQSDYHEPLNLGQDRLITINELVDIVAKIAGKKIAKKYDLSKPQGVRGRNSDNTLLSQILNWSPSVTLEVGLEATYNWIEEQLRKEKRI